MRIRSLSRLLPLSLLCATAAGAQVPSQVGQWSPLQNWPVSATHAHLLPTGKVMFFGEFEEGDEPPRLWDPGTDQLSLLPKADFNIFCSGHSYLADGKLLITGGHAESHVGFAYARIFDPFTSQWSTVPDMNDKRWYPTNTTLATGEVVVTSGETTHAGMINELPQVYQPGTNTWRDLTNAVRSLPYYPRMFLAPSGRIFFAGPWPTSRYLDPEGSGTWINVDKTVNAGRSYGTAVIYDGKVLIAGGGTPPTPTAEWIDLRSPTPTWQSAPPMRFARRQVQATLLPDGTVLMVGGSSGSDFDDEDAGIYAPEVFDPAANQWSTWAPAADYRGYHATALLLPDGRVLSAGGRNIRTMQVFSPPYLFKGARPTVRGAPSQVTPGTSFQVLTPERTEIAKVTLIALGSTTHAFDSNQRLLTLPFTVTGTGLNVTAPALNEEAPPGYYQLFLVNRAGVPSLGQMVRVVRKASAYQRVLRFSDTWKYDDRNVAQPSNWVGTAFDDSGWKSGAGQFGYGDDDESTRLTARSPATSTTYFRKSLRLDAPVTAAQLEALHDDGIAVWVNGQLVFSRFVDRGLAHEAWASSSVNNQFSKGTLSLNPNPFVLGENQIAVMVKQVSGTSTDLSFALALDVTTAPTTASLRVLAPNGGEQLTSGMPLELSWATTGTVPTVDLAYSLDGGATFIPLAQGVSNTGSYRWTPPHVESTQVKFRVSRSLPTYLADESDASFTFRMGEAPHPMEAIHFGDTWRYLDTGTDPGPLWKSLTFPDQGWKSGAGELGYGDHDETTQLTRTTPSQPTVYFRKRFQVNGSVSAAELQVRFDDGIAVWLNEQPLFSENVGRGLGHSAYASASTENLYRRVSVAAPERLFKQGDNVLSAVVKQVGPTSPDLTFDLALTLTQTSVAGHAASHEAP